MHLLVPFASDLTEACRHVLADLPLPNLERALALLAPAARDEADEYSHSPPHERALAAARGWHGNDGALPFAAHAATLDGIDVVHVPPVAWALLSPAHWQLGRDHVTLLDPDELALGTDESRALFESFRPLLESAGFVAAWGSASRWYAGRADLDGLATASLDRVIGRSVDLWLRASKLGDSPSQAAARSVVRRLQSEAQLLFHTHPVNEAREARGELAVNSFWLSGCGLAQTIAASSAPVLDASLRAPLLGADWTAWADAWRVLDAGPIAALLAVARAGSPAALTLCGERTAARFEARPRSLVQKLQGAWRKSEPHRVLTAL